MTKPTPDAIRATKIGRKTVAEWNTEWQSLENAFTDNHPELRSVVGLFRIQLNGHTKYIVQATEQKGGLAKALKRISGPEQTGNRGYGAQMIRKYIDQVKVDILPVEGLMDQSEITKNLKRKMSKLYDPDWAIPAKRRLKMIADGTIPPN